MNVSGSATTRNVRTRWFLKYTLRTDSIPWCRCNNRPIEEAHTSFSRGFGTVSTRTCMHHALRAEVLYAPCSHPETHRRNPLHLRRRRKNNYPCSLVMRPLLTIPNTCRLPLSGSDTSTNHVKIPPSSQTLSSAYDNSPTNAHTQCSGKLRGESSSS